MRALKSSVDDHLPARRLELFDDRHRRAGRRHHGQISSAEHVRHAGFGERRHVGKFGDARCSRHGQRPQMPLPSCGTAIGVSTNAKAVCPPSRLVINSLLLL